jgi:formylglycine-generating enzyme required for sulfatase activity
MLSRNARIAAPGSSPAKNMVWVPGGEFLMGSEDFYPEERPVHRVAVEGFCMDESPVSAAEFRRVRPRDPLHHGRRAPARPDRSWHPTGSALKVWWATRIPGSR